MRVLFIGNSHTYVNDMPHLFLEAAAKDGVNPEVTMLTHPGWYLDQHVEWPEVRFNLLFGHYDYVVVQEHAHPFGPVEKLYHGMKVVHDFAEQSGTKMVIYATWAPKKNPGVQGEMSEAHRKSQQELGCLLAPVDINWNQSLKEHPEVELYAADGEHASLAGSTIAANTIWQTVKADLQK